MLVALVALFAALAGTSYAAAQIGSSQIKNNSIRSIDVKNRSLTGKDVKSNSLGGAQVNESKLGKVGSATAADRAGSAGSAQTAVTAQKAGSADNAKNAQSATSAKTAANATTAGSADDADALGGQPADAFVRGVVYVHKITASNSDAVKFDDVPCPPGTNVIGGGAELDGAGGQDVAITDSQGVNDDGWSARAVEVNATANNWQLRVEAICAAT
jgi:hypothetical protein